MISPSSCFLQITIINVFFQRKRSLRLKQIHFVMKNYYFKAFPLAVLFNLLWSVINSKTEANLYHRFSTLVHVYA